MIVIKVIGIDPELVKDISKRTCGNLADLFEVPAEDILFIGSEDMVLFNGVDQYGLHVLIEIDCPEECQKTSPNIVKYLQEVFADYSVHSLIKFRFSRCLDEHLRLDETYPRYMTENNMVQLEEHSDNSEEVYDGDIFKDLESELE